MAEIGNSVAVLGTGALGGFYGGLLAQAKYDVHFLVRSDYEQLREQGLRVDSPLGDFHVQRPHVYRQAADMPAVDLVMVCWKTTSNAALAAALEPLMKANTTVLVLQNGWDVERTAVDAVGGQHVVGGCCFLCSNRIGPGHIHHLDYGAIACGEYQTGDGLTPRLQALQAMFQRANIDLRPSADLRLVRWKKLVWNIPFNGLSVLLSSDTRQLLEDSSAAALAHELMEEVREIAAANSTEIDEGHIEKMLADTRKMVPYDSSMLVDFRAGRPMEVESIFGNPLRAGLAAGYHARKIEMLYQALSYLDREHSGSSM